jgi:glycerol uptake facilitator-like aquaporin
MTLARRLTAEGVGIAFLLSAVVGSGIMGERLAAENFGLALLANTVATGAALVAVILTFGPIASTSFANPTVTLARALTDTFAGIRPTDVPSFVVAQLLGAAAATALFRWLVPSLPAVAPRVVAKDVARGDRR